MSNMENFSADELLKRLKENMGEHAEDEKTEQSAPAEPVEEISEEPIADEPATTLEQEEVPAPTVRVKKKYKIAARALREIDIPKVEQISDVEPEEAAVNNEETIAFDISSVIMQNELAADEPTGEFDAVSADEVEEIDAPTIEIPNVSELEAPDEAAFEAAAEEEKDPFRGFEQAAELDATDIGIIVAMGDREGMNKAKEQLGEEKLREYTTSLNIPEKEEEIEEAEEQFFDTDAYSVFSGDEYEKHEQTPEIVEKYKGEKSRIKLRLIGSAILALCLLIFENLHVLGVSLPGAFNAIEYPAVHTFVCLQLLVLAAALSYKEIIAGAMSARYFVFNTNTLAAATVAVTALCDLLIGFFGFGEEPRLYNFAAVFVLVLCAAHDYLNIRREMMSFGVVSSKKPKYVVTSENKYKITEQEFGFEAINEESDLWLNVKKVGFVDNYFARTNAKTDSNKYTPYFIFGAFAASVILAIVAAVNTKSAATAFEVANLTALMCLPVSLFTVSSLPFFLASKSALENDSAIIGEMSIGEYSGASTVVFDDKDVFPARSVKVKSIKVYEDTRIDTVLYDLTSVFSKLGGPLYEVLSKATAEIGHSDDVELVECSDTGVSAKVGDEKTVLVGDSAYMEQNDIFPVYDYEDEIQLAGGNIRIMYVACNGVLASKMYVQYAIDPDFDGLLRRLNRNGINVVIKTMDPNVDNTLLVGKAKPVNYPAKIEKRPMEEAGMQNVASADSGIVSRANIKSVVSAILLCDRLQHVRFTSNIVKIMSVIVGLVIMMIFTISNSSMLMLSLFVAIYHIFWMLPVFAISKMYLK